MKFGSKSPFNRDDDDEEDDDEEDDELTSGKSGKYSSGPERPGMGAFMSGSARKDDSKGSEKKDPFKPSTPPPPANKPAFGSSSSAFGSPRPGSAPPPKKDDAPPPKSGGFTFGGNKPPDKKDEPAKPAGGSFGSSGSPFAKPADKKDEPAKLAGGAFGSSGSPFGKPADKKEEPAKPAGGAFGSSSSSFGRKPDDKPADKKEEPAKPAGGGIFGRLPGGAGSKPEEKKDDPKKDEPAKPAGGGLFGGRLAGLGGGGKPEEKKDDPKKDTPKVTSGTPPPPSAGSTAPKPGGGTFGGSSSGTPGKPNDPPKPTNPFGSPGPSKPGDPPKPSGFGTTSPSKPADAPKPASGGFGTSQSAFGKPASPSSPSSGSSVSSGGSKPITPAFGGAKPGDPKPATPAAKKDDKAAPATPASGGFLGRFRGGGQEKPAGDTKATTAKTGDEPPRTGFSIAGMFNRGAAPAAPAKPGSKSAPAAGKKIPAKDAPPTRIEGKAAKPLEKGAGKEVKVKRTWSRDQQIDVIGIGIILFGLMLFFGVISPGNPGETEPFLTGPIVRILGQFVGYGRYFLFLPCWYVGGIFVFRHFGDKPLEVQYSRIVGWVLALFVLLTTLQQIEMFQPPVPTIEILARNSAAAASAMRGGGLIGDKIYILLTTAVGDGATFAIVLAWWVIAVMLALEITLSEITGYAKSVGRWVLGVQSGFQSSAQRARANRELRQMEAQKMQAAQVAAGTAPTNLPAGRSANLLNSGNVPPPPAPDAKLVPAGAAPVADAPRRGIGGIFNRNPGMAALPPATALEENKPAAVVTQPPATLPETSKPAPAGIFTSAPAATTAPPATSKPAPGAIFNRGTPAVAQPELIKTEAAPEPAKVEASKPSPFGMFNRNKPSEPAKAPEPVKVAEVAPVKSEPAKVEPAKPAPFGLFNRNKPSEPAKSEPAKAEAVAVAPAATPAKTEVIAPTKTEVISEPPPNAGDTRGASNTAPMKPFSAFGKPQSEPAKVDNAPAAKVEDKPASAPFAPKPAGTSPFAPKPSEPEKKIDSEPAAGIEDKPAGSPFTPKPSPFGSSQPAADKPAATATSSPFGAPKPPGTGLFGNRSVASPASSAASRPAANDDFDDEDEDGEEPIDMKPATPRFGGSATGSPFGPKPPGSIGGSPFGGAKSKPAPKPGSMPLDDKDEDDEPKYVPADDAPATPKSTTPSPFGSKPAGTSPFAPRPSQPAATNTPASNPASPLAPRPAFGGNVPASNSPFNRPSTPASAPIQPEKKPDEVSKPLAPAATIATNGDSKPTAISTPPEPVVVRSKQSGVWEMPEYSDLLERGSQAQADKEYLNERARIIEDTLQSFGAPGKVVEINTGPVITQFGVEPDYLVSRQGKKTRVKVGLIARLDADLALALAARTIRIEAPVPGKGYVGIEVPNSKPSVVSLRDIMDEPAYQQIKSRLRVALGRSVDGHPIVADLTAMPHLLIAGTTGSGKSVCVNAIISTLLLENSPDDLRFIMVDPKRVELTGYNGIPHMVDGMPVVVDLERIVGVLKWVTREMEERYKRFSAATARNIQDFNSKLQPGAQKLPYLVVVIDELADLMMLAPEETEKTLARLAQMARATGIHLIVSTQRPSVDVVTGLIKANFPARISFAVASSVDSRVILDQPGAEKLLGRGDMLYQAPDAAAPARCQGVYLSDNEITKITQYWKGQRGRSTTTTSLAPPNRAIMDVPPAEPIQSRSEKLGISNGVGSGSKPGTAAPKLFEKDPPPMNRPAVTSAPPGEDDDELYEEAVKIYKESDGKVGIQLLQRRLRVGYMRAARLIDLMKQRGLNVDNKPGVTEEPVEDEEA